MRAYLSEGMVLGLLLMPAMPAVAGDDCDSCPADFNCDGRVDAADMGLLLIAWDGDEPERDLSGDGLVNGQDLGLMVASWGDCQAGPNIDLLLPEPTAAEIAAVKADWASRNLQPEAWTVLVQMNLGGMQTLAVSHEVNGFTHYGLVRYPANFDPSSSYPALVANHGGNNGVTFGILGAYANQECYRNMFIVVPSFPGERLDTGPLGLGELVSGGAQSTFDTDIDSAIALVNCVLEEVPGVDPSRIIVTGGSRGGGVSYLMAVRDPRIIGAAILFGATDHITHPGLQEQVQSYLDNGGKGPYQNPVLMTVMEAGASDYFQGDMSLAEARRNLILRSVMYFAEDLPEALQFHHGTADSAVDVEHSRQLVDRLELLGSAYEYFEYEGGGHGSNMPQSTERILEFICDTAGR